MGTICANDAVRIKKKRIIHASGIMDGHAHHNSGACCPMPLIYAQLEEGSIKIYPTTAWGLRTREFCEFTAALQYKEGVRIQRLTTLDMGNHLATLNRQTFSNIRHSMDFAVNETRFIKEPIATPMIIATMDMEYAHIAGYEGQTIYHEENGELFYFERVYSDKPEREGIKRDLSHELLENRIIQIDEDSKLSFIKKAFEDKTLLISSVKDVSHEINEIITGIIDHGNSFVNYVIGDKPESKDVNSDLSNESTEKRIDQSMALKLRKWEFQCSETEAAAKKNPLHLLPLYFYDPRRFCKPSGTAFPKSKVYGAWDEIFNYIATESKPGIWAGVKMYPPLGHKPLDELCEYLPDFYYRCEKEKIPILTHCSPGGMTTHEAGYYLNFDMKNGVLCRKRYLARQKQLMKIASLTGKPASNAPCYPEEWGVNTGKFNRFLYDYFFKCYVHPEAWRPVLENFPDLHLCLAHFGGDEWRRGPISEWNDTPPSDWINSIVDLTKKYKNVYTDISCFNLEENLTGDNFEDKKVRHTLSKMFYWIRDRDEYKHLRNKVIFGTDWYLTHLTRSDDGAKYDNYCRDFKKLIDQVDPTFWVRFTLVNPWSCYSMSKGKLRKMADTLKAAGAIESVLYERLDRLLKLDDEVSCIKEQLTKWDT